MDGESRNDLYKECLRNHAASLGSYATDGCGEFTLEDTSPNSSLQCAACGCHRNFHRRVVSCSTGSRSRDIIHPESTTMMELVEYGDHGGGCRRPMSMMVVESGGDHQDQGERNSSGGPGTKRFRTKFSAEQKEKMLAFAEKLGWKLQRKDHHEEEDEVERFCRGVGVSRQVFKVWMHNHKNSSSSSANSAASAGNASSLTSQ